MSGKGREVAEPMKMVPENEATFIWDIPYARKDEPEIVDSIWLTFSFISRPEIQEGDAPVHAITSIPEVYTSRDLLAQVLPHLQQWVEAEVKDVEFEFQTGLANGNYSRATPTRYLDDEGWRKALQDLWDSRPKSYITVQWDYI